MANGSKNVLNETIDKAVNDLVEHGYDKAERVLYWQEQIRRAADAALKGEQFVTQTLRRVLGSVFKRLVGKGGMLRHHQGVERFTLERLTPTMRGELDRRIMASADLIRMNRKSAIEKTLQRFTGWSTSIPAGGTKAQPKPEVKADLKKSFRQLPFHERRVLIDQGHKLTASINEVMAQEGGAIAVVWHSHWRQAGYAFRPDHKERDKQVYAVRGSWAYEDGLAKKGDAGWYDDITAVAEEPFCRCYAEFIYNLRDLPKAMLTKKGEETLAQVRIDSEPVRLDAGPFQVFKCGRTGCSADLNKTNEPGVFQFTNLKTPPAARGQGGAKEVLSQATKFADTGRKTLRLLALPDDESNNGEARLKKLYRGFGFEEEKPGSSVMVRRPR